MAEGTEEEVLAERIIADLEFWAYRKLNMLKLNHDNILDLAIKFIVPEIKKLKESKLI